MKNVTGIMVTYNTKELAQKAYESVRNFHSEMKIIIVDGSDSKNPCYSYIKSLSDDNLLTLQLGINIGHGVGMHYGLMYCKTDYILFFDSDIEVVNSPVSEMLTMMSSDTYGVGLIEKSGLDGYEYGYYSHHKNEPSMSYLHPFFQLISKERYWDFHPYVHHGAPCYLAMLDIFKHGLSDKILKSFPGLHHTDGKGLNWEALPSQYVQHPTSGTRKANRSMGKNEIDPGWVFKTINQI